MDDLGYFAWKGLLLGADGPSVEEQGRRLTVLAGAYGVPIDDELLDAIEAAVARLRAKGRRDGWEPETLARIEEERRWQRANRERLLR